MIQPVYVSSQNPPPPAPPSRVGGSSPYPELAGKRVVVVEDEGITQLQIRKILRSKGLDVVGDAGDGQEAVAVVLETRPDIVLMDIRMPHMDGLEASRRILAEFSVCIVMLTAFSEDDYQQAAMEIGVCGYVIKPMTSESLMPQIQAAYRKYQGH